MTHGMAHVHGLELILEKCSKANYRFNMIPIKISIIFFHKSRGKVLNFRNARFPKPKPFRAVRRNRGALSTGTSRPVMEP